MDFSTAKSTRPPHTDDTQALRDYLVDTLETWLPRLIAGGKVYRGDFIAGSVNGEAGSSLKIRLTGEKRGLWIDHATGEHGDALALLAAALNVGIADAFKVAREMRGVGGMEQRPMPAPKSKEASPSDYTAAALRILDTCRESARARVAMYLQARGITLPLPPDILGTNVLRHADTGKAYPAMVARVRDVSGKVIGIHRTYLDHRLPKKASVEKAKMMLGDCRGGAVRLTKPSVDTLGLCEGIETGLSVMQMFAFPVWATLSTSGMRSVELPPHVKHVFIFADNDPPIDRPGRPLHGKRPGQLAAEELAGRLRSNGIAVEIRYPRLCDFNDDLLESMK